MNKQQNELLGVLVGLVRSTDNSPPTIDTYHTVVKGLSCLNQEEDLQEIITLVRKEKYRLVPDCAVCKAPCGRTSDFNSDDLWLEMNQELKEAKVRLLNQMIHIAQHQEEYTKENEDYFYDGLFMIGEAYSIQQVEDVYKRKVA